MVEWNRAKQRVALLTLLMVGTAPGAVLANPTGGAVVGGTATIKSSGSTLTIDQTTGKAVIDWSTFNISSGETTQFLQPSSSSVTLNRVTTGGASFIDGLLTANGNLIVVNANGVLFGKNSVVDVNGLVATTADIANNQFLSGSLTFSTPGNPNAVIENQGLISARQAGLVGLVAPTVLNSGVITAKLGRIQLASGDTATVDLYGDGLLEVQASPALQAQLVSNSGKLIGGSIDLTAATAAETVNSLVYVGGEIEANAVGTHAGSIYIYAPSSSSGAGDVTVAGQVSAAGTTADEIGGNVTITGDKVSMLSGASVDVSGSAGGGTVLIGGAWEGALGVYQASTVTIASGASIDASATQSGKGGEVVVRSDVSDANGATDFAGLIIADGAGGGGGGQVETSGHDLTLTGQVKTGQGGAWLLDPANVTLSSAADSNWTNQSGVFTPNSGASTDVVSTASGGALVTALNAGTNITITTTNSGSNGSGAGTITVASPLTTTGSGALTLSAASNIVDNASSAISLGGGLSMISSNGSITTNSAITAAGPVTLQAGNGAVKLNAGITDTASGAGILIEATTDVVTSSGTSSAPEVFQTNDGSITFWSASGGGTSGAISLGAYTTLNSANGTSQMTGGGAISLAGGASGATGPTGAPWLPTSGPTSYAIADTTYPQGVILNNGAVINSGGGNIFIAGQAKTTSGIDVYGVQMPSGSINAGDGEIGIYGQANATGSGTTNGSYGIYLSYTNYQQVDITSASTSPTAITLIGDASGTTISQGKGIVDGYNGGGSSGSTVPGVVITETGTGGGINLIGYAGSGATSYAASLGYTDLTTTDGPISFTGSTSVGSLFNDINHSAITVGGAYGLTLSTGGTVTFDATSTISAGAGVSIDSAGGAITAAPISAAGPVSLLAGNGAVKLDGGIMDTGAGAPILVEATTDIANAGGTSSVPQVFQTNDGSITFWSASGGGASGAISLGVYTTLNSANGSTSQMTGGGAISLAGGASGATGPTGAPWLPTSGPTSYAIADTTYPQGVILNNGAGINSGGGNIFIAGQAKTTSGIQVVGVDFPWGSINAGDGEIAIYGQANATGSGTTNGSYGIALSSTGYVASITSASTSPDAITMIGDASGSTVGSAKGIVDGYQAGGAAPGVVITATGTGGGITLIGYGGTGSSAYGVELNYTSLSTSDGPISITGNASGNDGLSFTNTTITPGGSGALSLATSGNLQINQAVSSAADIVFQAGGDIVDTASISSSGGSITLDANRGGLGGAISVSAPITTGGGDIILGGGTGPITPGSGYAEGDTAIGYGVTLTSSLNAGGGNIVINGESSPTSTTASRYGVNLGSGSSVSTSGSGSIEVSGIGQGTTAASEYGIDVDGSVSAANGTIALTGVGGVGTTAGANQAGVVVDTAASVTTSGTGLIDIAGTSESTSTAGSAHGVWIEASVQAQGSGSIVVTGQAGGAAGASNNVGAWIAPTGSVGTAGAGGISVTGFGGGSGTSGSGNEGVYSDAGYGVVTAGSGSIVLTGVAGGGTSYGIYGPVSNGYLNTGSGNITAYSDTFSLPASYAINTAGSVTLATYTNVSLGIGSSASGTTADISDPVLSDITGTSYIFGSPVTGNGSVATQPVVIDTTHNFSADNLTVISGGDLTLASSIADTGIVSFAATGNFINTAGSTPLTASQWVIYSAGPAGDTFDGLTSGNVALWGQTYATTPPATALAAVGSGDVYVFSTAGGVITATTTNDTKSYGATPSLSGDVSYAYSGLATNAATYGNVYLNTPMADAYGALPTISSTGQTANAHVVDGPYAIVASGGTADSGFSFAYVNSGLLTIDPATLTVSLANTGVTKTYDATENPGASFAPTWSTTGLISGDTGVGITYSGAYNSAHVATANTLTLSGLSLASISGSNGSLASDYNLVTSSVSVAAAITPAPLTETLTNTGVTKVYNATTDAPAGFTPSWSVSGFVTGDTAASLNYIGTAYNSAHVATADQVTVSGVTLTGVTGSNGSLTSDYSLTSPDPSVAAAITPAPLSATLTNTGVTKIYDGTTDAPAGFTPSWSVSGFVTGDTAASLNYASAAYNNANVVSATTLSVSGASVASVSGSNGSQASDYSLTASNSVGATITPATLTLSATKVYDGTTSLGGDVTLGGLIGSETLTYSGASSTGAHVESTGNYIDAITLSDGSGGGLVSNYQLPVLNATNAPVTITPAPLTEALTNTGVTKVYDGTTDAPAGFTPSWSVSGLVAGDTAASLNDTNAAYNSAHVDTADQVTVSGVALAGITGSNGSLTSDYALTASSASVAATITPAPLTASLTNAGVTKVYDGTTDAPADFTAAWSFSGFVAGDTAAGLGTTGTAYNSAHVVYADQVTVSGLALSSITGSNGSFTTDYALTSPSASVDATITPAPLTATLTNSGVTKAYDGTTDAPAGFTPSWGYAGLVSGDTAASLGYSSAAYNSPYSEYATTLTLGGLTISSLTGSNGSLASDYALTSTSANVAATITGGP